MQITNPTDAELRADCELILADHASYNWPRSLTVDGHSWGDWLDAAATALDCEDFSEIRWMRDLPDPEAESAAEFADWLYDFARDAVLVAQYEARSTYGMAVAS